jgi:uncharacterized membrane protein
MITPILLVLLLLSPVWIDKGLVQLGLKRERSAAAAPLGMALLFLFSASGHFLLTDAMAQMLPSAFPWRIMLIYVTGAVELAVAFAFLVPGARLIAAFAAVSLLIIFFPANVYAAFQRVPIGGHEWGPEYLLLRAPVQLILIGWIWRYARNQELNQESASHASA